MKQMKTIFGTLLITALCVIGRAEAASVQYVMDQSNTLEDNIDYLLVTISDDQSGQLDFMVETLPALNEIAGRNFGIASFGFYLDSAVELMNDDFLLPEKWKIQFNKGMSEAGKFDVRIMGTGQTRMDPLQFSVLGLDFGDIIPGFASHVAGFDTGNDSHDGWHEDREGWHDGRDWRDARDWRDGNDWHDGYDDKHGITSAYFYGDRLVSAVPVPAAVWLFGSGILLLGRIATRRRA